MTAATTKKKLTALLFAGALAFGAGACTNEEGNVEVDPDEVQEGAEDLGEDVQEGAEDLRDGVEEGVDEVREE